MRDFSLEELANVYREEKTSRELVELQEEFYPSVAKYISRLIFELKHADPLERELLQEELRNIVYMVQEIHFARVFKTIDKIAHGRLPSPLLERERYAFSEVRQSLEKLQTDLVYPAITGRVAVPAPHERTSILLLLLTDVAEKIVGADMRSYGPFAKGEVASLPAPNAEMLVRHGVARKIGVRA